MPVVWLNQLTWSSQLILIVSTYFGVVTYWIHSHFLQLSSRRAEMREAYFKSDVTGPKLDSLKTEKDNRDKEKYSSSISSMSSNSLSSSLGTHSAGQKENIIDGYVGFANLPNQVYRKAVKRGFEFTLMVVGK